MTQYNWENLSDHDFELVCRDILRAILGDKPVETFARGRDDGVDLRHSGDDGLVIGQAKHYTRSSFSSLKTAVIKEKSSLDKLVEKPARYLLMTSKPLTPGNKSELQGLLSPYCVRTSDILGIEDIESWIQNTPEIELTHYKLWLASVRVMGAILGNATKNRSNLRVQEISRRARLFVAHRSMAPAEDILRAERSLVISGPAGIGKTTLAEMIALRFLASGYEVDFVSGVDEIEREMREGSKQLFVYDDFLGRTSLSEAPSHSAQERLFTIMGHFRRSSGKYLIMTTREYIYQEARTANDRMKNSRADIIRCVLDVNGYDRETRARILYNHLYWHESIPEGELAEFVTSRGYIPVIQHKEFNPRFIADTISRVYPVSVAPIQGEDEGPWA